MSTDNLTQLLTNIRSHARKLAIAWLDGEQVIGTFWEEASSFVGVRWDELPTADQDSLVDAFGETVKGLIVERAAKSDSGEWTSPHGATVIFVKETPAAVSSVVPAPLVPEVVKAAQEGSVCEVAPLGLTFFGTRLEFEDTCGQSCVMKVEETDRVWFLVGNSTMSLSDKQIPSLIAHLTAWLHTGSFDLKGLPPSPPSSEDTELLTSVDPGDGWRLLKEGEPLQEGDGFLHPSCRGHWLDYECRPDIFRGNKSTGCPVKDYAHTWPWRRSIKASTTSQKGGQGA